ncbi:hypothetical protein JW935_14055 [candidate division KSB1 bacterium]|nr:hypothetical protein [candidate division KSB1 bacterium]
MPSNWEKIKKSIKDELSDALTTTKKYLKIGKGKWAIRNIKNSLNDTFRELGIKVYKQISEEIKGDIRHNPEVKSLVEKVNQLKQFMKDEELEVEGFKKESVPQTKKD